MEEKTKQPEREEKIEIGPLGKDGEKMMKSVEAGNMVAVLSGTEIMYAFLYRNKYQCFIHPIGEEEGRYRSWDKNAKNRAMLKNLDSTADQLFEIKYDKKLNYMGVMVTAERAIYNFLCTIGQKPGEDVDFMDAIEESPTKGQAQ
ncbi:MAG: hypothetical protein IJY96_08505 [Oscillospiraceae bacterium]|nr:hypothetical protein [Oscillospiraceae bacterium]